MRRVLRFSSLGLATLLAVLSVADSTTVAAGRPKFVRGAERLDAALRAVLQEATPQPQRVIIRTQPGARASLGRTLAAHGDQILVEHESIEALTVVVHGEDLDDLAGSDAILSVSLDHRVRPHGQVDGVLRLAAGTVGGLIKVVGNVLLPNGADTSGAAVPPAVLRTTLGVNGSQWTGRGVGVAVIDSGLEMSPDFSGRVTAFYDFTTGGIVARSPYDDYGHGTHVAGTIGGSGARSTGRDYRGLAPDVKFVVLKVLDKDGAGYTSDVIRAIDFAVANRSRFDVDVINLSLGHPIFEPAATDPLVQAVERASRAGVIVVAAAGNLGKNPDTGLTGYAGITSPGNAPSAITVGAVRTEDTVSRTDDRIADYSSAGPTWYDAYVKPDLVSPGHNIVASAARQGTLYRTYPQLKDAEDPDYMRLSGTSMATAVTSGSVALVLEANRAANEGGPSLTPNAVKAILQHTALGIHDGAGIEYDPLRKGAGSLNPKGAIDLGRRIDNSRSHGQWWLTSTPNPWTSIDGDAYSWNQGIIWGTGIIWGSAAYYNQTAWGTGIIWGSSTTWSNGIIWGSNVVWTNPQTWSQGIIWGSDNIGQDHGAGIIWGSAGPTAESTAWNDLDGSGTSASGQ